MMGQFERFNSCICEVMWTSEAWCEEKKKKKKSQRKRIRSELKDAYMKAKERKKEK